MNMMPRDIPSDQSNEFGAFVSRRNVLIFVSLAVAVLTFFDRGVDFRTWHLYGFADYSDTLLHWQAHYDFSPYATFIRQGCSSLLYWWGLIYQHVPRSLETYLSLAILARVGFFYLLYRLCQELIGAPFLSMLAAVALAMAHPRAYGFSLNDMWGGLAFDHHHIAFLMLTGGILLALRRQGFVAGCLISLSIHLHPLNGALAYGFFVGTMLVILIRDKDWKNAVPLAVLPLLSIAYLNLKPHFGEPAALVAGGLSMEEWFRAAMGGLGMRDSSNIYNWLSFSTFLIPLVLALHTVKRGLWSIDRLLCWFFLAVTVGMVCLEVGHRLGFFWGGISVLAILFAVCRAFWLLMLFCVAGVFAAQAEDTLYEQPKYLVFASAVLIHLVMNSLVSSLFLTGCSLFILRDRRLTFTLAALFAGVGYVLYAFSAAGVLGPDLRAPLNVTGERASLVLCGMSVGLLPLLQNDRARLQGLCVLLGASILLGLVPAKMISGVKGVATLARVERVSSTDLMVLRGDDADDLQKIKEALGAVDPYVGKGHIMLPILTPPSYAHQHKIYPYVSPYDNMFSFSYLYAQDYNRRLKALFGRGIVDIYNERWPHSMIEAYDELDGAQLRKAMEAENIAAAIVKRPIPELNTVFSNGKYWVVVP